MPIPAVCANVAAVEPEPFDRKPIAMGCPIRDERAQ
jgi:hypothetical protein